MITVITGKPGSGKTTYVEDQRARGDVVLDFDALAYALGSNVDHHAVPHLPAHSAAAKVAWKAVVQHIIAWRRQGTFWIINADPGSWQLEQYERYGSKIINMEEI